METLPAIDIAVLVVYILGVVAFGCWFVRNSRTTEGFMAANRSLPGWAVGMSIFGTYLSSNTFIGVPGKAFGSNWNSFVFGLSLPLAAMIAVSVFVPFYRRTGEISAYQHLERRFGTWARMLAVICYLLTQVVRMGSIMLGVALGLHALVGWDMATIIIVTGALVTLYTLLGGIEAVIWTDVAQSIVLMIGAIGVVVILLIDMPGGPGQVFAIAAENNKFSLGSFGATLTAPTFWVVLVYGLVMNLNNFGIDQSFVQRYQTARSDREAAKSVWLGALLYLPISAVFFFIGTALFAYYQTQPEMLAEVRYKVAAARLAESDASGVDGPVTDSTEREAAIAEEAAKLQPAEIGDKVLPHFIVAKLPAGMAGLLIAAIFAAAMSSIDTSLNSSATIVLSDIYKRFVRCEAGERESMTVLYATTLAFGALGTTVAISLIGVKSVLDAWWILSGIFVGGMLGVFLLGLISRRAGSFAAIVGVVAGVAMILWMSLSPMPWWPVEWASFRCPLHKFLIPVVGTATIVVVGLLVGLLVAGRGLQTDNPGDDHCE